VTGRPEPFTVLCPNQDRGLSFPRHSECVRPRTTTAVTHSSDLPIRTRLLRELERDGASGEFLRQYFLCRGSLSVDDLRVLWEALVGRAQGRTLLLT
jgi:hypothetical protein